ncbi:WXG100 family type VII secretion target [Rhodococcus sp. NPDC004095]
MAPNPLEHLTDPTATDPVPDLVENIIGGSQYISASYWVGQVADLVCGTNPWEWVAEQFAGDWEVVSKAGHALANLAEYNRTCADVIRSGVDGVRHTWDGNAADAAAAYFAELGAAVNDQARVVEQIGDQLTAMATGMYEAAQGLKGLWEFLMDLLIQAAVEMAAAAATGTTVIGPLLVGAVAAVTITRAMGVWGEVLTLHSNTWNAVQGGVGVIAGTLGGLHDLDANRLPVRSYDHPGV